MMDAPELVMTDLPLERLEAVFQGAADLPADRRAAFLERECAGAPDLRARVEAMLAELERGESLGSAHLPTAEDAEGAGTLIGRYKLLQTLGEGGFGVVYMAEQTEPVVRKVALKIIKLGMDTREVVARFEAERQALALMDHPNIARVFDGGATDAGRPFFAMELVRGISITEYCDTNNLTTRERVELFLPVCQAVQHAHQKGIIHRDLKPSNVMITLHDGKPIPKVIDFGVAKAMHTRLTEKTLFTHYQRFIGTPAYMSPEQAELSALDVDTRTDIYSLGVLLYELLTGSTPFDPSALLEGGLGEIQRVIREKEPERPSMRISTSADAEVAARRRENLPGLSRLLKGDLDWIVLKALEKERGRRYGTASELAADLERHLNDEPVLAGPPGALYRARKFLARNRVAVTTALVVLLALIGGTVGTTLGMLEASVQRDEAVASRRAGDELLDFLIDTIALTDPEVALDPRASIQVLLASAAGRIEGGFQGQPLAEARLRSTIGRAYESLGQNELAEAQLRRAVDLLDAIDGVDGALFHDTLWTLTNVCFRLERPDAFAVAHRAQTVGHDFVRASHPELADALDRFAFADAEAAHAPDDGRAREAIELLHECVALSEAVLEPGAAEWRVLATTYMAAAYNLWYTKHEPYSVPILEEVLAIQRRELPPNHPDTGETMGQLVGVLNRLGRPEEAEARIVESVALMREVYGDDNFHVALARSMLGANLVEQGRFEEAEPLLVEGHRKIVASIDDPANFYVYDSHTRMVLLYSRWGREEDARPHREAIAAAAASGWVVPPWQLAVFAFGPGYERLEAAIARLDELCDAIGYSARAGGRGAAELERPVAELLEAWREALEPDDARSLILSRFLLGWANALSDEERGGALAERMAREALVALDERADDLPHEVAEAHVLLALAADRRGDAPAASREARVAAGLLRKKANRDSWWSTITRVRVARGLVALGRLAEAEAILVPACEVIAAQLGPQHSETTETRRILAALYTAEGEPEKAREYEPEPADR